MDLMIKKRRIEKLNKKNSTKNIPHIGASEHPYLVEFKVDDQLSREQRAENLFDFLDFLLGEK